MRCSCEYCSLSCIYAFFIEIFSLDGRVSVVLVTRASNKLVLSNDGWRKRTVQRYVTLNNLKTILHENYVLSIARVTYFTVGKKGKKRWKVGLSDINIYNNC